MEAVAEGHGILQTQQGTMNTLQEDKRIMEHVTQDLDRIEEEA